MLVRRVDDDAHAFAVVVADDLLEQIGRQLVDLRTRAPAVLVLADLGEVGLGGEVLVEQLAIGRPRFDVVGTAVAVRAGDRAAGGEDPRADDRAALLLRAQPHDVFGPVARVEDGGHAGIQIAVQRADALAFLVGGRLAAAAAAAQMDVRVDQTRDQELAGAVDDRRAGRRLHGRADVPDAVALDDDRGARHRRPAGAVDERDAANGDDGALRAEPRG